MFPPNFELFASSKVTSLFAPVTRGYSAGHGAGPRPRLAATPLRLIRRDACRNQHRVKIVPPQRAVWLPPNSVHETRMLTDVHLASLYLKRTEKWSFDCEVMEISKLLRELIVAALQIRPGRKRSRRDNLIADLIVEELQAAPRGLSPIPLPANQRLLTIYKTVIANPTAGVLLTELSADVGSTSKTISRLFQQESASASAIGGSSCRSPMRRPISFKACRSRSLRPGWGIRPAHFP